MIGPTPKKPGGREKTGKKPGKLQFPEPPCTPKPPRMPPPPRPPGGGDHTWPNPFKKGR